MSRLLLSPEWHAAHPVHNLRMFDYPVYRQKRRSRLFFLESLIWKIGKKLTKVDKLVELCGFVPLALCIAGTLLSHYDEDELIKSLEDEPSDVLQVGRRPTDQTSVQKSIKRSFENLNEVEQKALALLCLPWLIQF